MSLLCGHSRRYNSDCKGASLCGQRPSWVGKPLFGAACWFSGSIGPHRQSQPRNGAYGTGMGRTRYPRRDRSKLWTEHPSTGLLSVCSMGTLRLLLGLGLRIVNPGHRLRRRRWRLPLAGGHGPDDCSDHNDGAPGPSPSGTGEERLIPPTNRSAVGVSSQYQTGSATGLWHLETGEDRDSHPLPSISPNPLL